MKRFVILSMFLMINLLFSINLEFSDNGNQVNISGNANIEISNLRADDTEFIELISENQAVSGKIGDPKLPVYTRLIDLPNNGNYKIKKVSYEYDEIDIDKKLIPIGWEDKAELNSEIYSKDEWFPQKIASVSRANIMRNYRFSQIMVAHVQYNPIRQKLRVLKNIDIDFELDMADKENSLQKQNSLNSQSFSQIARENILRVPQAGIYQSGLYLYVIPNNSQIENILQPLLRSKEKLGHRTKVVTTSETGSSNVSIKNYLQDAYDNWEIPPEYVILVGDVSGSFVIPSNYIEGYLYAWDVTDHNYTLLSGDDYFPDIFIGRLSVHSLTELQTIVSKFTNYPIDPPAGNWFKKALMCCYVGYDFTSPRETKIQIKEKLLDFTYTEVDTFFAPYQTSEYQLINMINDGYTFINYRGYGAHSYWSGAYGSMFNIYNIQDLGNEYKLPMITSIVCGGGDFSAGEESSCFGETWLNAGYPGNPKGAIGFIGPSERDTKTPFNNAYDIGIYQGVTQEGLFKCGEMLLRGKMELYNNYPDCHDMDGNNDALDSDQFYFYVYNLLGDPGISIWTDTPRYAEFEIDEQIDFGSDHLPVSIQSNFPDKAGFCLAITNDDSLVTTCFTDDEGNADIPIDLPVGDYAVTASKYGYKPFTEEFSVAIDDIITLYDHAFLSEPVSGSELEIELELKNLSSSDAENITINAISEDNSVHIESEEISIGSITAGENHFCNIAVSIADHWQNGKEAPIKIQVASNLGEDAFLIRIPIQSPDLRISSFSVANSENCLLQNENAEVYIELKNEGEQTAEVLEVQIIDLNSNTNILSANSFYNDIPIDGFEMNLTALEVQVNEVISGESARFRLDVYSNNKMVQQIFTTQTIGLIGEVSPTFGSGGYYAIESDDQGYFTAPEYDWIEINPNYGGAGTHIVPTHYTGDGSVGIKPLPESFSFQYFGNEYEHISVGTNGYLSMGICNLIFHRNRTIPSGIGPNAMIAPFWDDLYNGNTYYYYDEAEHKIIVEWYNYRCSNAPYHEQTFQVILFDTDYYPTPSSNGNILFQYKEINNADQMENYATIGIENYSQTDGLLLSFANEEVPTAHEIADETAILFTTLETNDNPVLSVYPGEIQVSAAEGSSQSKNMIFTNNGLPEDAVEYSIVLEEQAAAGGNEQRPLDWLTLDSYSGTIAGEETAEILLIFSAENLPIGDYYGTMVISSDADQELLVPIHLTVDETGTNGEEVGSDFRLFQNYPNPFHSSTTISFQLTTENTECTGISIYNIKGQRVRQLGIKNYESGMNEIIWNGKDNVGKSVKSGIYFYKLTAGAEQTIRKMILMR